jgi:hypothetical protein
MAHPDNDVRHVRGENRVTDSEFVHIIADIVSRDGSMTLEPDDVLRLEEISLFLAKCPPRIGVRLAKDNAIKERINGDRSPEGSCSAA